MNDLIEGLNEVQAEAVVHNEGPLLILSGAGSAEKAEQIQQAAFIFARVTRGAEEIADVLRVSSRTVQRMIHLPAFQEELDRLGYQGERRFGKAHRAQRSAHAEGRIPESQATVGADDRHPRTRSREGHRRNDRSRIATTTKPATQFR